MQITIQPTKDVTVIDGVRVRAWEGLTDKGILCVVYVRAISVSGDKPSDDFERELLRIPNPQEEIVSLDEVLRRNNLRSL
jgi:hypothetical protein